MTVRPFDEVFRDFVIPNVPASGVFHPEKKDIRDSLNAVIAGPFPDNRVIRLNNANAGTANNIVVTASVAIPAAAYQVLYILNVTQENTGPVKVSGAINRDLVTNTSRPIEPGYLKPGMALLCIDTGTQLRLLSYGNAEAILAAAEAAADRAEAAAEAAEATAGSLSVNFETIALAKAANIPAVVKYMVIAGRNSVGDGDGGMYVRVASPALGSNIIQNGDFASDTAWTKGTGWTIASGKASKAITASASELRQSPTGLRPGLLYAVTYTITGYTGTGGVYVFLGYSGTTVSGVVRYSNGTFTEYLTNNTNISVCVRAGADVACSVDDISCRSVSEAFQSADGAWWELRANVADKNVLTPSTPSMGISSTKIKDDLSGKFSGAVVRIVSDKFQDLVSARDFGAFGMSNDYTTELQTFLNQMKPTGLKAWLPRGEYALSSTLVLNNAGTNVQPGVKPEKNEILYRTAIVGDGAGSTILRYVGSGAALHINTGLGKAHHRGFSLVQDDNVNRSGVGLKVDWSAALKFSDMEIKGFEYGLHNLDSFSILYEAIYFEDNSVGFIGGYEQGSHPNAINFISCRWMNNKNSGVTLINPTTCNFIGGSFEGNGTGDNQTGALSINGASSEGAFGCNITGVYFENNFCLADIVINNAGSGGRVGMHRIKGCTFNRISNIRFTDHNIYIGRNSPGFLRVVASENSFQGFNTYVPSAARKYIVAVDAGGGVPSIVANDNLYGNASETPA